MFLSRNKKNNVFPCKPQFYYIKVGFKGSTLYRYVFVMFYKMPRQKRLCMFCKILQNFVVEDEEHVLLTVLDMVPLDKSCLKTILVILSKLSQVGRSGKI